MFQFSLRNLLVAIAFVAVGCAALLNANGWWSSLMWGGVFTMLFLAILLVIQRQEEQRAYWGGFAVAGTLYLLLLIYSIQPTSSSNSSVLCYLPLTHYNLITTKLMVWSYSLLPASKTTHQFPVQSTAFDPNGNLVVLYTDGTSVVASSGLLRGGSSPPGGFSGPLPYSGGMGPPGNISALPNPAYLDQSTFTEVGHALWTFFLSWVGGTISFWLYRTRKKPAERPAPPGAA